MAGSANPLRQQMINMMYLVLTALLALNISKDILKAFAMVNQGLMETNLSYDDKNTKSMQIITKANQLDPAKNGAIFNKATQAKKIAADAFAEIEGLKDSLAFMSDGYLENEETGEINRASVKKDDDREVTTMFFIHNGHATELRARLTKFRDEMLALVDPKDKGAVNFDLPIEDPPATEDQAADWEKYYWEDIPAVAALTQLTKFQNDVRNAEGVMLNYLVNKIGAEDIKFDNVMPVITVNKSALLQGETFEAQIGLGAYSSTQVPNITVGGQKLEVQGGRGTFKTKASGQGEQTVKGQIAVKWNDKDTVFPFTTTYQVFTGNATIAAPKMNVLYIGLENPIEVSAPGFRPEDINASISGGVRWSGGKGKYTAVPAAGSPREVTVNVSVKTNEGTRQMGSQIYRIRPVPKPYFIFGTKDATSDYITRGELQTINFVFATLGEGFAFDGLKYDVLEWTITYLPRNTAGGVQFWQENIRGNTIPSGVKSKLGGVRAGDVIAISNVKARGPQNVGVVNMGGLNFTIR